MFVSWISSLETKRKMPNSCPSLVFLRFLQTAGDEEDEVLSNSCSNKLGSKTQPQMAAVPQAKSKPYHWAWELGGGSIWLLKSQLTSIWSWSYCSMCFPYDEILWKWFGIFFYIFLRFFDTLLCLSLSGLIHVFDVSCERIEFALFCSIVS